jgi:hypothetical protein
MEMTDVPESPEISFSKALFGPLLKDEQSARDFAVLILTGLYGEAELAKQKPLRVNDQGSHWLILGSYQQPGKPPSAGACFIRVRKSDCQVEKFGHYQPLDLPEEVRAVIESRNANRS